MFIEEKSDSDKTQILLAEKAFQHVVKNIHNGKQLPGTKISDRKLAKDLALDKRVLFQLSDTRYCLFPWMGTTAFRTLERIVRFIGGKHLNITKVTGFTPYYLQFDSDPQNIDKLLEQLKELCNQVESPYQLMDANEKFIWRLSKVVR